MVAHLKALISSYKALDSALGALFRYCFLHECCNQYEFIVKESYASFRRLYTAISDFSRDANVDMSDLRCIEALHSRLLSHAGNYAMFQKRVSMEGFKDDLPF